jgi:hypothetical protein
MGLGSDLLYLRKGVALEEVRQTRQGLGLLAGYSLKLTDFRTLAQDFLLE